MPGISGGGFSDAAKTWFGKLGGAAEASASHVQPKILTPPDAIVAPTVLDREAILNRFQRIPTAIEFQAFLAETGGRYVIPDLSSPAIHRFSPAGLSVLDRLTPALRRLDGHVAPSEKSGLGTRPLGLKAFDIKLGDKVARVEKAGVGALGHVLCVTVDGRRYAVKMLNDSARIDTHGSLAESGILSYASALDAQGIIKLHAANPNAGWFVLDWGKFPP